jgi:hypothetical protein
MIARRPITRAAIASLATCLMASEAHAETTEACASAAERAHALRRTSKLLEAREQLLVCAAATCPAVVQSLCTKWLSDVDVALPALTIRAQDSRGRDVVGVHVILDGRMWMDRLTGLPLTINPGLHRLRYETPAGSSKEEEVLVAEGERGRVLTVQFAVPLAQDGTADDSVVTAARAASSEPRPSPSAGKKTIVPYIVGGAALAALGSFFYFELSSWSDYRRLRDECGQTREGCSSSDVDAIRAKITVALVSLGVGALGLGAATWLFLSPAPDRSVRARLDLRPVTGGGMAGVSGLF